MSDDFQKYIDRTAKIRFLSTPSLSDIENADEYAVKLRENFQIIGKLAKENREFLDSFFYPFLKKSENLNEEEINQLTSFGDFLVNPEAAESLDLPIVSLISDRLVSQASADGNLYKEIKEKAI